MLSEQELSNLCVFIDAGAKAITADKRLEESFRIQGEAVSLINKLRDLNKPKEADSPQE